MSAPHGTEPGESGPPKGRAATPDTVTWISLGLLVVFALLLLAQVVGLGRVPVWVLALLLLARLGVQFWSARQGAVHQGAGQVRRRASGWVIDLALIGLLLYVGLGQK